jgi:hypothetical protein
MKLKCTKINNVDKAVCTAEQKIAYNYASSYVNMGKKILKSDTPEFVKADALYQIEMLVTKDLLNKVKSDNYKFNIDAIVVAFRQGFRNFCENSFIAFDYATIGNCFKIPYEVC